MQTEKNMLNYAARKNLLNDANRTTEFADLYRGKAAFAFFCRDH